MKGKLARVKYDVNLYKYEVSTERVGVRALTDDLVIIIDTNCYGANEYLVHHQRLSKQYYICKWALELVE